MTFEGTDNTYAMGDHADHIHVGFRPLYGSNSKAAKQINAVLKPQQWIKLVDRLRRDREPDGAPHAVEVRAQGQAARGHHRGRLIRPGAW